MGLENLEWLESFETLKDLADDDRNLIARSASFNRSSAGDVAYSEGDYCEAFRRFVWNNCGQLMSDLIVLIEEVTFRRVDIRLARWLCAKASGGHAIETTHQEIAIELGTAREVVSRLLKDFERKRFLSLSRGQIVINQPSEFGDWIVRSSA